ncbi:MAG: flagellar motor switch protein FliN [Sulfuricellaceae bacterium]|nr:flagellar motor switch protein FliN [Sulfuricellaceae bacterium]
MAEDDPKDDDMADDWAAAMAEQSEAAAAGDDSAADDWGAALAEQAEVDARAAQSASAAQPEPAKIFAPLTAEPSSAPVSVPQNLDLVLDIPVNLTVELGRTKIAIRNLLQLAQGSVVELDGLAGEPMSVLVNGCLIAQGEVVVVNDKFGIRLTDIISPTDRIRKLNR